MISAGWVHSTGSVVSSATAGALGCSGGFSSTRCHGTTDTVHLEEPMQLDDVKELRQVGGSLNLESPASLRKRSRESHQQTCEGPIDMLDHTEVESYRCESRLGQLAVILCQRLTVFLPRELALRENREDGIPISVDRQ